MHTKIDVRPVEPAHADYESVLGLALDPGSAPRRRSGPFVADLLAASRREGSSLDLAFAAYHEGCLEAACAALTSPGAAALVYISNPGRNDIKKLALHAALEALQHAAWAQSIKLLEVLVDSKSGAQPAVLERAGFHYLTELLYLTRRPNGPTPSTPDPGGLTWKSYEPATTPQFHAAIEASYVQSLDCPELTGLRPTADVVAGHRAAGVFDPALWWVVERHEQPVGVLLLSRLAAGSAAEIVYVGVAQPARGTGVADALLGRAVTIARELGVNSLTLAVDARNYPARRLYRRWHFTQTAVRHAWIASPDMA